MKKERGLLWRNFVKALSLPEDAFVSQTYMELFGQKEIVVNGAKSIIEYGNEVVRIQTKEQIVEINGDELRVDMFLEKVMIVRGKIQAVFFE